MSVLNISRVGNASVIVDIVRKGNVKVRPAYKMKPSQIAIHNTGNAGRGAGARAHNNYLHNQSRLPVASTSHVSWHFSVDDKYIYQHIPLNESAWHTGDGSGASSGNRTSIGIEICENPDMNYARAEENAIRLAVLLMRMYKIPISRVKSHQQFNGKYCPRVILRRDGSFTPFRRRINNAYIGGQSSHVPSPPTTSGNSVPSGQGIVAYMVSKGMDSSYSKRARLAKQYGINNYSGTASQNTALLGHLKSQANTSGSGIGIVAYMNEQGMDSSYTNRSRLAKQYGISNYRGTATQNNLLLSKLRQGSSANAVKVGVIQVDVWTQQNASFSPNRRVKVLKKGTRWKVFDDKNGYYQVAKNEWVNKKYMDLV